MVTFLGTFVLINFLKILMSSDKSVLGAFRTHATKPITEYLVFTIYQNFTLALSTKMYCAILQCTCEVLFRKAFIVHEMSQYPPFVSVARMLRRPSTCLILFSVKCKVTNINTFLLFPILSGKELHHQMCEAFNI